MSKKDIKVGDYVVVSFNTMPRVAKVLKIEKGRWGGEVFTVEGLVTSSFRKGSQYQRRYNSIYIQKFDEKWLANHLRNETDNWNKALKIVAKDIATGAEKSTRRDLPEG